MTSLYLKKMVSLMLTLCTSQINSWNMTGGAIMEKMRFFVFIFFLNTKMVPETPIITTVA